MDGTRSTTYWTGTVKDRNDWFLEKEMKTEDIPQRGNTRMGEVGGEITYGNSFVQNKEWVRAVSRAAHPAA